MALLSDCALVPELKAITKQRVCPICFDITLQTGTCVNEHAWPPTGAMQIVQPPPARDELLDLPNRPAFWSARAALPKYTDAGERRAREPDLVSTAVFRHVDDETLRSTVADLRRVLDSADIELKLRQLREDASRSDGKCARFFSQLSPTRWPKDASESEEIDQLANHTLAVQPLDLRRYVRSLGLRRVRRMKSGRNAYFYQLRVGERWSFVRVNYSSAIE